MQLPKKAKCPVPGKCLTACVVYEAKVSTATDNAYYIGSTGGNFKTRYTGHKQSFTTDYKRSATALSQFVWSNNLNPEPNIQWKFLKVAKPYSPGLYSCDVCNTEKLLILKASKTVNTSINAMKLWKCAHIRQNSGWTTYSHIGGQVQWQYFSA